MPSDDFKSLFTDSREAELHRSSLRLEAITRGMWLPGGAGGRRLAFPTLLRLSRGLALPERVRPEARPAPIDYVGTYVTLKDYVDPQELPGGSSEAVAEQILSFQDPHVLLWQLTFLSHLFHVAGEANRFVVGYRDVLRPDLRPGFDEALAKENGEGQDTLLFGRQAVLAALRAVLKTYPWVEEGREQSSLVTAILLVHAVGSAMSELEGSGARTIGNMPADLMMELVRNGMLYEQDDDYSVIDRTLRYWREQIVNLKRTQLRDNPHELFEEALGVPFEDFFAMGVWLWGRARTREPYDLDDLATPAGLPDVRLPRERVQTFLDRVSAQPRGGSRRSLRAVTLSTISCQSRLGPSCTSMRLCLYSMNPFFCRSSPSMGYSGRSTTMSATITLISTDSAGLRRMARRWRRWLRSGSGRWHPHSRARIEINPSIRRRILRKPTLAGGGLMLSWTTGTVSTFTRS
jgi:hypothetical protein